MKATPSLLTGYLALITCCNSGTAKAVEDLMDLSLDELGAIPVTTIATGTSKPIFESAAVTTVITAEQIKSMGATELHEVLETVPGVHASLQGSTYDYHYTVRGIRNVSGSEVLVMLNGTRITTPLLGTTMTGLELPVAAIQKVEVIRGPGSALYGADAFAGVINIITKKTKDINGTIVGARVGDHSTQSGWGQYGDQWAGWNIAASLQYQHTSGDNGRIIKADSQTTFDNIFGTHASHAPGPMNTRYETYNGFLNLQRKHWDIGFWGFSELTGARAGVAAALDPVGRANGQQYVGDVKFSTEDWFENLEIFANASYREAKLQAPFQLFPNNAVLPIGSDGNIGSPSIRGLVNFPDGVNVDLGRIERIPSIELSGLYKGFTDHLLRVGGGFRYEEITVSEGKNFGPGTIDGEILLPPPAINVRDGTLTTTTGTENISLANTSRNILSAFVQDEWQITKDWQLTAGVRYDNYSDFGNTVNPRAALVWNVNEQFTTKLLYGKAFRAPSFAEQGNDNNPTLLGNKNLKPEKINTFEWAVDYRPFSSVRTAANLYYYQIKDLIGVSPDPEQVTRSFKNVGDQNGYGSELEWNWQVNDQVTVMGNYAWQYAINQQTHQRVAGVPEHHIYFATQWQFMPGWQLQPQINWIGGRTTAGDTRPLDDYETIDITLRGKKLFGHLDVAASLRNMFDTTYREPAVVPVTQLPQNLPMPGRSFYLEASVHF